MSKSSGRWLQEHFADEYVRQAQRLGYRSRACFKLLEIQQKDKLIKPGMRVLDLGAAPGGWSQVAAELVGESGRVIASDILSMDYLPGVTFIQGDFTEDAVYQAILHAINGQVDVVISDMAPNMSGMSTVDQPRSMHLAELALDMAKRVLKPNGAFLCKIFQGEGFDHFFNQLRVDFRQRTARKPQASRPRSKEVYLLAKGYNE